MSCTVPSSVIGEATSAIAGARAGRLASRMANTSTSICTAEERIDGKRTEWASG